MTGYFKWQIVFFFRIIIGIVFIKASLDKIAHPAEFAKVIGLYDAVPFGLENLMAMAMPWLELLVGICLVAGFMVDGAAIMSVVMMVVFIFAISQALARGLTFECSCFSVTENSGDKIGLPTILRDIVLLVMSLWVLYRSERKFEFFP